MARRAATILPALIVVLVMVLPALAVVVPAADGESRLNDGFRSFVEIEAQLRSLAENNSDIAVLYDLGDLYPNDNGTTKTTHEGRHFWGMKISDNPLINETEEPDILYVGMHHAREWMTTEMMMWLIEHILADYGTNSTITDIVDNRELWMFPVQNPDGFVYSESVRDWRKNRRDNGLPDVGRNWGVDPNRNYGYKWGYDDTGSNPNPNNDLYRGPYPFSEPCTQIMRDMAYAVSFEMAISFHTYGDVMLYPTCYTRQHTPHNPFFRELGRRMAEHNGYEYGNVADGILYTVNGGFDDFMYFNTSCLPFTYEMNSAAQGGFYPDSSLIVPTCTMNYEAALELAKAPANLYHMFDGGINGTVVDPRGNPLEDVYVNISLLAGDALNFTTGPDGLFSFHAPDGRFYDITAEKDGYSRWSDSHQVRWDTNLTNVTITIKDNVPPMIARVEASHDGEVGTEFGIGQQVRIDVFEERGEVDLTGVITIQSVPAQYFHRRKPLSHDGATGSYYYLWDTSDLEPRNDYLVTTELWDIDENRDKDGVAPGGPDLTLTLRDITPPMVPINLSVEAQPEGGTLVMSWEANTDDTETYTLERRTGLDGEWSVLINLTEEETTFTDQGLENEVAYTYRLMAWDKVPLPSGWSVAVTGTPRDLVPPGEVLGLAINAPVIGGILEISWKDSTDDTATYVLYKDSGQGFEELGTFPRGVTRYTDTDVVNDQTYRYQVSSFDAAGNEGPRSPSVLGLPRDTTPPPLPQVDRLPELTNRSEHQVTGTAEANSTVIAMVNQEEAARFDVLPDGTFGGAMEFDDGINRVSFKCIDAALNPSGHTEPVLVHVDLNPPRVKYSEPGPGQRGIPVEVVVSFVISEALLTETVTATLTYADTGERVTIVFAYAESTKIITAAASTPLDKGRDYKVVVDGTDVAGNHLTGGELTFTTVKEEEPEPVVSGSMVMLLVAIILVIVVVVVVVKMMGGKEPPQEHAEMPPPEDPPTSTPPEGPPSYPQEYDPTPPGAEEPLEDGEWEED